MDSKDQDLPIGEVMLFCPICIENAFFDNNGNEVTCKVCDCVLEIEPSTSTKEDAEEATETLPTEIETLPTGISIRDYFAGLALRSIIDKDKGLYPENHSVEISLDAYRFADAMLKAREATNKDNEARQS